MEWEIAQLLGRVRGCDAGATRHQDALPQQVTRGAFQSFYKLFTAFLLLRRDNPLIASMVRRSDHRRLHSIPNAALPKPRIPCMRYAHTVAHSAGNGDVSFGKCLCSHAGEGFARTF